MVLSKAQWEEASSQKPSPTDLYEVLEDHAPKALTLDEIRGRGDPQQRESTPEDTLQRVRIQTLLDTMIYMGDIEKKTINGEAYYRPTVWISKPNIYGSGTTEKAD